ncbi:MAG TPA: proline--tRNA ligase, partial [Candidatus Limnocylindria bacterium]|nr:proline--tRNA ligase [Candidatus Limnocylindria bacterium]
AHASAEILSYRQLPVMVYHFQSKGRDEARPRAGLLRVREFVMKDAYSFDADQAGLEKSYRAQHGAYARIFGRMGLDAISVESDTGAMGGDIAHEFQVLTDAGDDRIAICSNGDYKANLEKATRTLPSAGRSDAGTPIEISTPGVTTIEQLQESLGRPASAFLKTILIKAKDQVVAVVLPGDRSVNEAKLRKLLDVPELTFANEAGFATSGGVAGFVGPVGLRARILVDASVDTSRAYVAGANKKDAHLDRVVLGRDFDGERVDAHDVAEGDTCPKCGTGALTIKRGVEVGNIFAYGTYYSTKMHATFLAEDGTRRPFFGGSYGIGIGRAVQTIIETHNDERGIMWPIAVAPYQVHVIALPSNDEAVRASADSLALDLERAGVEVLYDDREESAGVKFADSDLIGIPFRATVSKRTLKEDKVELKPRTASEAELIARGSAVERIAGTVRRALA